jgi:hypothetical protein
MGPILALHSVRVEDKMITDPDRIKSMAFGCPRTLDDVFA